MSSVLETIRNRLLAFLFEVRSEPNTIPLQSQVMVAALYVVAAVAAMGVPFNMAIDWNAGSYGAVVGEALFSALLLAGLVSFWVTRRLKLPRFFYSLAVLVITIQLVVDAGGQWGMGSLYIVSGYSVIFFALGLRGGVLIPLILLIGTLIRLPLGHFSPLSIFNSPDLSNRFLTVLFIATALGIAAVVYQHFLVRNLARLAYVDPVSGLASRVRIQEFLAESLRQARLHHGHLSLIAFKIQNFTQVNSTQGSLRADEVMREMGGRLKQVPTGTLVGRYSGTMFLVATREADPAQLTQLGVLLHNFLTQPYHVGGLPVTLPCEVAVTRYPQDGDNEQKLLANLLTTLGHAEGVPPGQVMFFDPQHAEEDQYRYRLAEELRQAISRQEFTLVYHPKLNLRTNTCQGAEVLLRWTSGRTGAVGPDVFIPLAEATGTIREITNWVLQQSFHEISQLDQALVHAINLSPLDLADPHLLGYIDEQLAAHGLEARHIEFEITEGVLMDDDATIQDVLERLRNRGHRLAIDDFGTGYSSLSYLTRLRVNNLKIDQSFIRPLEDTAKAGTTAKHRIVEAVISMARALNLDITAEGVETSAQADYLNRTGCTYGQGWLYAKPMPLEEYRKWLASRS
ncbi:MAG: bifunctional diguanylate cyclase/phosphodiesterase [Spirochaetales bacterium]